MGGNREMGVVIGGRIRTCYFSFVCVMRLCLPLVLF